MAARKDDKPKAGGSKIDALREMRERQAKEIEEARRAPKPPPADPIEVEVPEVPKAFEGSTIRRGSQRFVAKKAAAKKGKVAVKKGKGRGK